MKISLFFGAVVGLLILNSCNESKQEKELVREVQISSEFVMPALPNEVEFCGEKVQIDNFDKEERLDKELIVNTYFHSSTIQYFKRANRYFSQISKILEEENVPDDMKYLCLIESALTQATSRSGAKGFWQFMPATAKEYGLTVNAEVDERLNINKSTRAACKYLKDANSKFNNWSLTAASYNRGMGGISSDLESQYVEDYYDLHLNTETSRYVFRILALKLIFETPDKYGFNLSKMEMYQPLKTKKIKITESISDLKKWSIDHQSNYRMLKLLNPWLLTNKLTINGDEYIIELPV